MRRTAIGLTMVVLMLLLNAHELMGGGSGNPPPPGKKITGPAVSAHIVIDPHNPGVTPTAGQASIRLQKGTLNSGAAFKVPNPDTFPLALGCVLILSEGNPLGQPAGTNLTEFRFVHTSEIERKLTDWIPSLIITDLFAQLQITLDGTNVPVITDVDNAVCTTGPGIPDPGDDSAEGILSFQAVIQFRVPHR